MEPWKIKRGSREKKKKENNQSFIFVAWEIPTVIDNHWKGYRIFAIRSKHYPPHPYLLSNLSRRITDKAGDIIPIGKRWLFVLKCPCKENVIGFKIIQGDEI